MNVDEFEFLGRAVGAGARVVFDVGAKYGRYTGQFLRLFPEATIYAVDCAPNAVERLHRDFGSQRHVKIVPLAFGNVYGGSAFLFHLCQMAGSSSIHPITDTFAQETCNTQMVQVEGTTLDEFCQERSIKQIDLLKIDTEGSDLHIVRGARHLLEAKAIKAIHTEMLFFPYYQNQCWYYEIAQHLVERGFELKAMWPTYWGNRIRYAQAFFELAG